MVKRDKAFREATRSWSRLRHFSKSEVIVKDIRSWRVDASAKVFSTEA